MFRNVVFLLVCFLSSNLYSQTEKDQKIQKVQERRSQSIPINNSTNNYNSGYQQGYSNGYNDSRGNSGWNRNPYYYNPYDVGYYPYWNVNRGWDGRNYVMTTDPKLTQKNNREPMRLSLGVILERDNFQYQMSPYIIMGGETFMVVQYHTTLPLLYPYYNNIETWEVESWGDGNAGNVETKSDFSIGAGRTVDRFSPFMTVGITSRKRYDAYYDDLYVLSSRNQNGIYLINEQKTINMSIRGGLLYHWNYLELVAQIRYDGRIGAGLGVGLKL